MICKQYTQSELSARIEANLLRENNIVMWSLHGSTLTIWFSTGSAFDNKEKFDILEEPLFRKEIFRILVDEAIAEFQDFLILAMPLIQQIREARAIMAHEGLKERTMDE